MSENNRPARPRDAQPSRFGEAAPRDAQPSRFGEPRAERPARTAPAPRPAGSRPAGGSDWVPRGFWPLCGICALILVAGLLLQGLMPNGFPLKTEEASQTAAVTMISEIHGDGPVRLNEIMSSNGGVLVDNAGETPDWVEVANIGNRPVNLNGYVLAKSAKAGNVFVFPDVMLQAGDCAIVYADSTLQAELGEELHAPFRLSSEGDTLMLFNAADVAVDTVNLPALDENVAYVRRDRNTWARDAQSTPGLLNTEENYRAMTSVTVTSDVKLWEIVASNTQYAPDETGVFHDYVVLRNTSAEAVDLSGWYLSDNPRLPRLWKIPSGVTIAAGGTLRIYCSGLNRMDNPAYLHTSFRLSTEGETVTLSNASGQPVDSVTYDLLRSDTAYLRGADGSWSVGTPTN